MVAASKISTTCEMAWMMAEAHRRKLDMCAALEDIADLLPANVDAFKCLSVANALAPLHEGNPPLRGERYFPDLRGATHRRRACAFGATAKGRACRGPGLCRGTDRSADGDRSWRTGFQPRGRRLHAARIFRINPPPCGVRARACPAGHRCAGSVRSDS